MNSTLYYGISKTNIILDNINQLEKIKEVNFGNVFKDISPDTNFKYINYNFESLFWNDPNLFSSYNIPNNWLSSNANNTINEMIEKANEILAGILTSTIV